MRWLMAASGVMMLFGAGSLAAKEGIVAMINSAEFAGDTVHLVWQLADPERSRPFNTDGVFIRLVGPTGGTTESISAPVGHGEGRYQATVQLPPGGIDRIEIGVTGAMKHPDGRRERSDWLVSVIEASEPR